MNDIALLILLQTVDIEFVTQYVFDVMLLMELIQSLSQMSTINPPNRRLYKSTRRTAQYKLHSQYERGIKQLQIEKQ